MFSSLDEQMKRDEAAATDMRERWMKHALVAVVSILFVCALYVGMLFLE